MKNLYAAKDGTRCAHGVLDPAIQSAQSGTAIVSCDACERKMLTADRDRLTRENAALREALVWALVRIATDNYNLHSSQPLWADLANARKALDDAP